MDPLPHVVSYDPHGCFELRDQALLVHVAAGFGINTRCGADGGDLNVQCGHQEPNVRCGIIPDEVNVYC